LLRKESQKENIEIRQVISKAINLEKFLLRKDSQKETQSDAKLFL
jgi:hypothetical protein